MKQESKQITQTVKQLLKVQGKRYPELAEYLGISLASVKRILNGSDIQVSKLSQISNFLGLDFFELIEKSKSENQKVFKFTVEQELFLSQEINHFLILRMLLMHDTKQKIMKNLNISEQKINKVLFALEKVDLIELHPNDIIKNKIHFPVKWIENGMLEKTYNELIINKISNTIKSVGINRKYNSTQSHINVKELLLTQNESLELKSKFSDLIKSYDMVTKIRLDSHEEYEIVSVASVVGAFSWWD